MPQLSTIKSMAIGLIKTCQKCGDVYDSGNDFGDHYCEPYKIRQYQAKKFLIEEGYGSRLTSAIQYLEVIDLLSRFKTLP